MTNVTDNRPPAALLELATIIMVVRMAGDQCMVDDCDDAAIVLAGVPLPEGGYGYAPCCGRCLRTNLDAFMVEPKR